MKRGTKVLLITLGVVAAILSAVQFALSPIARNYINNNGEELLGRKVSVGKLRINIFTTSLTAGDIVIYEQDGASPFVSCGEFSTRMRLLPLFGERFIISRISLRDAMINILQDGNEFNYDDLTERFATDSTRAAPGAWEVGIYNIGLYNSGLSYRDLQLKSDWELRDITLEVPGFYLSSRQTDAGLQLDFPDGGSLKSSIAYDYLDGTYDLKVSLRDFTIDGLLPYMRQYMNVSKIEGSLGGEVRIKGRTQNVFDLDVSGTAWLHGFDLVDDERREVVRADSAAVDIAGINLQEQRYLLRELTVWGMHTHYEMYADSTHSFSRLMRTDLPEETDETPMSILINRMDFVAGDIEVTDHTLYEPFDFRISDINVHADGFCPDGFCTVTADATLHGTGKAKLHWAGNPSNTANHDITLSLHNVDMTRFSPYTVTMFGYPFSHGTFSFTGQNRIRDNQLTGMNHLDIYRPTLDKKRKDVKAQYNVPLKTGIYLLTDRNGRLKIDLPVTGDLNSPQFSYGKIITSAVVNTLVKVVTSPAKYLAGAMGISSDELESIEIDVLQDEFTSEQYDKISQLSRIMRERPELKLSLTHRINYEQALGNEALVQLKTAYYLRNNPAKAGIVLDMLEREAALAVDVKNKQLTAFADSLIVASGGRPSGDLTARARTLYSSQAEAKLLERAATRNTLLATHLCTELGHADTTFTLAPVVLDSLKKYKGRSCYAVSFALAEEGEYKAGAQPQ